MNGGPPVTLRPRPSRAVPAIICGLVLLAVGVLLIWAAIARLAQGQWPPFFTAVSDWLASLSWNSVGAWVAGILLAVVGLALLLAVFIPGRFHSLRLHLEPQREVVGRSQAVMSRRAAARLAAATCEHIDGVSSATATATDREVRVTVNTALRDTADLQHWVADGVRSRLQAAGLDPVPAITVIIRSGN
ncbi:DUF6286 domain-containing protein [Arthrobacter sp. zg-Y820]|uniref:DUF6286 domain-containing protein n=1 Tax=unclassified Arthrobacter TaxID=235627 RepID=UPI00254256E5|nr:MULTISPECIES: DUF6286 domain-containing protein [unclassified Arthrobacter]MCC9197219.1 DUF6286 domain-containing protein [Arthrobacter sp. zg-Y820]MDK1280084.1 DUF6286 domain-containing protein [Arthrobacter sp. zg.Y820]WIB09377.1 DUF6286 domain-containing protein [Arthrobacter sp. zg-Y820]